DHTILEDKRHLAEAAGVERAEDQLLAFQGLAQVIDPVGDMRPVPELPQANLVGRHLGRYLRADIFYPLRVLPRVGDPDLAEGDPALVRVRLIRRDADVIEGLFHGADLAGQVCPDSATWRPGLGVERDADRIVTSPPFVRRNTVLS